MKLHGGKGRLALQAVKPPDRSSLAHHPEVEQNLVLLGSSSRRKSINQSDTQTPRERPPRPGGEAVLSAFRKEGGYRYSAPSRSLSCPHGWQPGEQVAELHRSKASPEASSTGVWCPRQTPGGTRWPRLLPSLRFTSPFCPLSQWSAEIPPGIL